MGISHAIKTSPSRPAGRSLPRLSYRSGFWAVAFAFLVVAAFSTAPSSLYGLYEQRGHLSSLTVTFVYAVYALGVVGSLLLAGHVSDWYGRRVVLLPAIAVAIVEAVLFLVWRSLPGLFVARVLTGVAVGAAVATHCVYHGSGLRASWPADSAGWDRQHDRKHRRSGLRAPDSWAARPLRTARPHAPVPGLPCCPRARVHRHRGLARRSSRCSCSSQIPAAAPLGSGE